MVCPEIWENRLGYAPKFAVVLENRLGHVPKLAFPIIGRRPIVWFPLKLTMERSTVLKHIPGWQ